MSASRQHVLISWIGGNDLKAIDSDQPGPIFSTLQSASFDAVVLLHSYPVDQVKPFLSWLGSWVDVPLTSHHEPLSSPVNFREIFLAARKHLSALKESDVQVFFKHKRFFWEFIKGLYDGEIVSV